ncbi:MAG: BrnA antitoxin family protein [Methylocystis sp.]|nr:BrnA antitoxin family protein [Methylocystis sp.]
MSRKAPPDAENPEWTRKDFEKARPASELPPDVRMAFPRMRGAQKAAKKIPVSIRLSPEVVARFKAGGPGWQARIDEALKKALGL